MSQRTLIYQRDYPDKGSFFLLLKRTLFAQLSIVKLGFVNHRFPNYKYLNIKL